MRGFRSRLILSILACAAILYATARMTAHQSGTGQQDENYQEERYGGKSQLQQQAEQQVHTAHSEARVRAVGKAGR